MTARFIISSLVMLLAGQLLYRSEGSDMANAMRGIGLGLSVLSTILLCVCLLFALLR